MNSKTAKILACDVLPNNIGNKIEREWSKQNYSFKMFISIFKMYL